MGKVLSIALRPIKSFNIENRAHRLIGKDKPTAAPHYPGTFQDIQRALEAEPDLVEKLSKKNDDLEKRLRDVFVSSEGSNEDVFLKQRHNPNRPLPRDRTVLPDFEYGLKEPETVTYGKTTLRHVLQFLADHQVNPKEFTAAKIAVDYKLREQDVDTILRHFQTFEIYVPATKTRPAQFAGPAQLRKQIEANQKQLEEADHTEKLEMAKDKKAS